jgi:predicted transcriptional regulator
MTTKKPTLLIRLDAQTKADLKKAADADRRSMAFLAEELILEGLRRKSAKKPRS